MEEYGFKKQEKEIFKLKDIILRKAEKRGITLRLLGGVAIREHCPKYKPLHYRFGRRLPDIDLAGYLNQVVEIQRLFLDLGFEEDGNVMRLFGTKRRIFDLSNGIHSDVVLDKLRFCHDIDLRGRLEIDYPTIPLADLLLSKLQIVEINERDVLDLVVLLLEHRVGASDDETINVVYLARLCSKEWGLWKTATDNLNKVALNLHMYLGNEKEVRDTRSKVEAILERINTEKKSLRWKMRARLGNRVKWYREVEELDRTVSGA